MSTDAYDYEASDIVKALKSVGVQKGDILFPHVGMGFLGKAKEGSDKDVIARMIVDAFREVLGPEGTLIVPTYTYSFCNGEDYDVAHSPSTVGYFTEAFRTLPGVVRSREPIFSVAGLGPRAGELFKDLPATSFGADCIYDRRVKAGASICNVGVGFRYATFIHYVEKSAGVPYRFDKTFKGTIIEGGEKALAEMTYYVRTTVDDTDSWPDLTRLEEDARTRGILHEASLGRSVVTRAGCREVLELGTEAIKKNPWYLAQGFYTHVQ
jgi:aminoglycoside 3-N-acetyltransferase